MDKFKNGWPVLLIIPLLVVIFNDTFVVLHDSWTKWDEAYSHGYIIVALVVYWITRETLLTKAEPAAGYWCVPLFLLLAALFTWYAGRIIQFQVLEQLSLPAIGWSWCFLVAGWPLARRLIVPFALGALAIPLWDVFISPLQDMTVYVVTHLVDIFGLTAYIENNQVHIPSGVLVIADGCAGLNLFLVSLSIGAIYTYMYLVKARSIIACISLLLVLGLATNWLRVFLLVVIADQSEMKSELVSEHGSFGWWLFAAVLLVFFFCYRVVEKKAVGPLTDELRGWYPLGNPKLWAGLFFLLLAPLRASQLAAGDHMMSDPQADLLMEVDSLVKVDSAAWEPEFSGYDTANHWIVKQADSEIWLSIYSYYEQYQGKELIYYSNQIAPKYGKRMLNIELNELAPNIPPVNVAVVDSGAGQSRLVIWSYRVGYWYTRSRLKAKLIQLPASFTSRHSAELVILDFPCAGEAVCGSEAGIEDFIKHKTVLNEIFTQLNNYP